MNHDNEHNDEQPVFNETCSNISEVLGPEEDDDIESLTNANEVGDIHKDLYMDVNESSIVPLEFEQVCSTLRMKLKDPRVQQFRRLMSVPIIDYLHPKKGMEAYFEKWRDGQKKWNPQL